MSDESQAAAEAPPTLDEIRTAREWLGERVRRTPVWRMRGRRLNGVMNNDLDDEPISFGRDLPERDRCRVRD